MSFGRLQASPPTLLASFLGAFSAFVAAHIRVQIHFRWAMTPGKLWATLQKYIKTKTLCHQCWGTCLQPTNDNRWCPQKLFLLVPMVLHFGGLLASAPLLGAPFAALLTARLETPFAAYFAARLAALLAALLETRRAALLAAPWAPPGVLPTVLRKGDPRSGAERRAASKALVLPEARPAMLPGVLPKEGLQAKPSKCRTMDTSTKNFWGGGTPSVVICPIAPPHPWAMGQMTTDGAPPQKKTFCTSVHGPAL